MLMSVIVFMLPLSIAEMKASCNSGGSEICNLLDFSNESEMREADAGELWYASNREPFHH